MMENTNLDFLKWFDQWYCESVSEQMSVSISSPSDLDMIDDKSGNYIILNQFKSKFVSVDFVNHLNEFISQADKCKIDIYTDCHIPFSEQTKRGIKKEELVDFFTKFGFEKYSKAELFMVRYYKRD